MTGAPCLLRLYIFFSVYWNKFRPSEIEVFPYKLNCDFRGSYPKDFSYLALYFLERQKARIQRIECTISSVITLTHRKLYCLIQHCTWASHLVKLIYFSSMLVQDSSFPFQKFAGSNTRRYPRWFQRTSGFNTARKLIEIPRSSSACYPPSVQCRSKNQIHLCGLRQRRHHCAGEFDACIHQFASTRAASIRE